MVITESVIPHPNSACAPSNFATSFLEGFEGRHALRHGYVKLRALVPSYQPTKASPHNTARAVMIALNTVGTHMQQAA